jgi:hypothetical protein
MKTYFLNCLASFYNKGFDAVDSAAALVRILGYGCPPRNATGYKPMIFAFDTNEMGPHIRHLNQDLL